jgi:hypothetical protein
MFISRGCDPNCDFLFQFSKKLNKNKIEKGCLQNVKALSEDAMALVSNPDLPSEASDHLGESGEAAAEETCLQVYER